VGKEMIARAIHQAGPRAERPFIAVNCAALPETLLESELFGHRRGAFTGAVDERKGRFEEANGGTIFLDEIGDIPPPTQVKLLRELQERRFERLGGEPVRPRGCADHRRHERGSRANGGRRRLPGGPLLPLNVIPIYLPPLRDRREDIPALTEHFLERFNREHGKSVTFSREALDLLLDYRWTGTSGSWRTSWSGRWSWRRAGDPRAGPPPGDPPSRRTPRLPVPAPPGPPAGPAAPAGPSPLRAPSPGQRARGEYLKELEREELRRALEGTGWVIARAAKVLGWTPRQVAYKMKKFGLSSPGNSAGFCR
jgi:Nif-specific regulatory protein